jgi:hypothetical protein
MYVVNVCLRLVPRCVSTGPVVVHLAENVNVNSSGLVRVVCINMNTKDSNCVSYDAIARRSRRGSAASSVREVRDSFNRKRFRIRLVD